MARTFGKAWTEEASRKFFSFKAPDPEAEPPYGVSMTRDEWESLSPGYRRAISREWAMRGPKDPDAEIAEQTPEADMQTLKERRSRVEYEGRKRL